MEEDNKTNNRRFFKPGLVGAIIVFAIVILAMIYVFGYAQYYLGMWGLLLTELGILVIAIVGMLVFRVNIKEAIPLRRVKINEIAGTILLWAGTFLLIMILNLIMFYFFPDGMEVGVELSEFIKSWPPVAAVLLVSVTPAICEEALHRGFLQSCVRSSVKNKWLTCIIVGVLFGINHMDIYRFIGTAILGGVMAYILVETDNFWYNMMFHFMNNFFVEVVSLMSGDNSVKQLQDIDLQEFMPFGIASYLIYGCVVPEMLLGGVMLIKGLKRIKEWSKTKLIVSIVVAGVISVLMFLAGVMLLVVLIASTDMREVINLGGFINV